MKAGRNAVVFLGGGRITSALLAGLRLAGFRQPIVVHDRNPHKLRQLQRLYDVQAEPDLHLLNQDGNSLVHSAHTVASRR